MCGFQVPTRHLPKIKTLILAFHCSDIPVGAISLFGQSVCVMNELDRSIEIFDRLRKFTYKITIDNGMEIMLRFSREHYHHLGGFQHLTDLKTVSNPVSRQKFFNDVKKGKITRDHLEKSCQYPLVQERIASFEILEQILSSGSGKIIVEFDKNKTGSVINARFHLFHRMGNPFKGEAVYYTLFINSESDGIYYPITYVVEHSNLYVRDQLMHNCTIACLARNPKKELLPL